MPAAAPVSSGIRVARTGSNKHGLARPARQTAGARAPASLRHEC